MMRLKFIINVKNMNSNKKPVKNKELTDGAMRISFNIIYFSPKIIYTLEDLHP
jgi:hypothetical protein